MARGYDAEEVKVRLISLLSDSKTGLSELKFLQNLESIELQ